MRRAARKIEYRIVSSVKIVSVKVAITNGPKPMPTTFMMKRKRNVTCPRKWFGVTLSSVSHRQLWVPPGFAHGFLVLSDVAEVEYKCTAYYAPEDEASIAWDDPVLQIAWPLPSGVIPILSDKDAAAPGFEWFCNEGVL